MLKKIMKKAYDEGIDGAEDAIINTCMTYKDLGELFAELLEYGGGQYDDEAVQMMARMLRDFVDETAY